MMKKYLKLIISIILAAVLASCGNGMTENEAAESENIALEDSNNMTDDTNNNMNQETVIARMYNNGLRFPASVTSVKYNGYTYELAEEWIEQAKQKKSVLYRYIDADNKEVWYEFGKSGDNHIKGVFINGNLFYIQGDSGYDGSCYLKKLDLETLIVEKLVSDNRMDEMFQYNNYIMITCHNKIISYDLLQNTKKTVIHSDDLDGYEKLTGEKVFACNNKIWIVRWNSDSDSKMFNADLDGSNLKYAGFSVRDFGNICSVNEKASELEYETRASYVPDGKGYMMKETKKISISLITGEILGAFDDDEAQTKPSEEIKMDVVEFDDSGVKVENVQ